MLKLENVGKIYSTGNNLAVGIRKVNLEFDIGEFVAITGESGSGKSTLLNILSGIDSYEEGEMYVNGEETSYFSTEDLENYRNKYVGFIFQNYNIIDSYTVLKNVEASLLFLNISKEERIKKAKELIERVGLKDRMHTKASKLSGGEKQRVVIARALAKNPPIIAADEPTGNLDSKSSAEIIELLHEISKDKLVLIVTHDFNEVEQYATRLIRVYDSEIKEDRILKDKVSNDEILIDLEEEVKRTNTKDLFSLSITDLLSSPKRAVFYFLVILLMSLFCMLSLAVYRFAAQETGMTYSSSFNNTDSRRIVVNKVDRTYFSDDEIEKIKNMTQVEYVFENDILLDEYYYFNVVNDDDEYFFLDEFIASIKNIENEKLVAGEMPKNNDEVVVSVSKNDFTAEFDSFESFLGCKVENYIKSYKVVGVYDSSSNGESLSSYLYLSDEEYENRKMSSYFLNYVDIECTYDYNDEEVKTTLDYFNFVVDERLKDDEIVFFETYYFDNVTNFKKIKLSDKYHDLFIIEDIKMVYPDEINKELISGYSSIFVSQNNYNLIMNEANKTYQISIFLKSGSSVNINNVKTKLKEMNYFAIVPSTDGIEINILSSLISGVIFFGISIFFLNSLIIIYLVLLHSIKSRKDDIEILRTIGAKEKDIKKMFTFEFTFIGLVSYIITIILYFVFVLIADGEFKQMMLELTFFDFIILLAVIVLMNLALSYLFSKKMFKKTVRKSLSER